MLVLDMIGLFCVVLIAACFLYEGIASIKETNESNNW